MSEEGYDADISQGRMDVRGSFVFLGPQNVLTAGNSAVHYSLSPYAYVMNNPLTYIDPLGLDTGKVNQLKEVTVTGKKNNGYTPWGPGLIVLGEPFNFLKPVGALGSAPGSSIASRVLSKAIPLESTVFKKTTVKVLSKVIGKRAAKKIASRVVGRLLGRLVPYVGWALTAKDAWDYREEIGMGMQAIAKGAQDHYRMNAEAARTGNMENWVCFVKGTLVYGKNKTIPIENIKAGDQVYSYDTETNKVEVGKVVKVLKRQVQKAYEVLAGNESIIVTEEHPMFVIGRGWIKVKNLERGDFLKSINNSKVQIKNITELRKMFDVYNIEVNGNHNYFVTNSRILVHNKKITEVKNNRFDSQHKKNDE